MENKNEKLIVGYARVSTPTQKLDRQIANLKAAYPNIVIVSETYSGKTENRPKWQKLLRQCRSGIVSKLVFDEVSRFSRNAEEAVKEYKELYNLGIELEFLKEPHINSSVYKQASERQININTDSMDNETANLLNTVISGLNEYLFAVAEKQIYLAFEHAQKERELLSKRTSEGLKQAKLMGSKVGRQKGDKIVTKKKKKVIKIIRNRYKEFGGDLSATEIYKICNVTKSTFYRYLNELKAEDELNGIIWSNEPLIDEKSNITREEVIEKIKQNEKAKREKEESNDKISKDENN